MKEFTNVVITDIAFLLEAEGILNGRQTHEAYAKSIGDIKDRHNMLKSLMNMGIGVIHEGNGYYAISVPDETSILPPVPPPAMKERRLRNVHKNEIGSILEHEGVITIADDFIIYGMMLSNPVRMRDAKDYLAPFGVYLLYEGYSKYTIVISDSPVQPAETSGSSKCKSIW